MSRYIPKVPKSTKDENGIYTREAEVEAVAPLPLSELSIDELLKQGLVSIHRMMRIIDESIRTQSHDRNTIMNLKDCMTMLQGLKEHEKEILEDMSEEDLEKHANK